MRVDTAERIREVRSVIEKVYGRASESDNRDCVRLEALLRRLGDLNDSLPRRSDLLDYFLGGTISLEVGELLRELKELESRLKGPRKKPVS